ncbi:hypothetical protein [Parvicella tangerina]|uniref:Response regulatory domain-containing protein n=1 Tax=Parvicella tangerina TaxID=2829795 RepID=A0A916N945_9FLAO|nr:hypothetical protein [Parvicella tangerina]CAG5076382.1 hypothetical protein CRYO30217_00092 [Parvicella tangerina]
MPLNNNYIVKIAVLDDSTFYTSILKRQIENTLYHISSDKAIDFSLSVYTHTNDFLQSIPSKHDILFLDFYLDDGQSALSVLDRIDPFKNDIKVAMVSQYENQYTVDKAIAKGAMTFIQKDKDLLIKASDFVDYIVRSYF